MTSVLQSWVMDLPLREQGTLLTCVRGCDLTPKRPYDSPERQLTAWLRYCFMIPADIREVTVKGAFMQSVPPDEFSQSDLGHYPMHWVAHIMHAYQIVGVRHPVDIVRAEAFTIYNKLATGLHLFPEPASVMMRRMTEDRIANGTVVS